jgi:hypothetical protein
VSTLRSILPSITPTTPQAHSKSRGPGHRYSQHAAQHPQHSARPRVSFSRWLRLCRSCGNIPSLPPRLAPGAIAGWCITISCPFSGVKSWRRSTRDAHARPQSYGSTPAPRAAVPRDLTFPASNVESRHQALTELSTRSPVFFPGSTAACSGRCISPPSAAALLPPPLPPTTCRARSAPTVSHPTTPIWV